MQKLITILVVAFVVFYVVTQPDGAAGIVHSAIHGLNKLAHGFGSFVSSL